jgi:ABC-type Fe3+ transport system permease subunit
VVEGKFQMTIRRHALASWLALGVALAAPALTCAQNCALCYTQAAASGSRMIAALRSGILILAVPPTLICAGITWMAYKKRNQFNDDSGCEEEACLRDAAEKIALPRAEGDRVNLPLHD